MYRGYKWIALVVLILAECGDGFVSRVDSRRNSNFPAQENGNDDKIDVWSWGRSHASEHPGYSSPAQQDEEENPGFPDGSINPRPPRQNSFFNGNFRSGTGSLKFESHNQRDRLTGYGFGRRRKENAFDSLSGGNRDSEPNKYKDGPLKFTHESSIPNGYNGKNWNFETKTEGHGDFNAWPDDKRRGGSSSSSSTGKWQSNFGFAGNSNQFSNTWNSMQKESKTDEYSDAFSDHNQGEQRKGYPNNRDSSIDAKKNPKDKENGGANGNANKWQSKPIGQNAKPFLSATGNWHKKADNEKEASFSGNPSPDSNGEGIDWSEMERENKKSTLILNLSQLWYPSHKTNDRGRPSNVRLARKREVEGKRNGNGGTAYICTGYEDCLPKAGIELVPRVEDMIRDIRPSNVPKCIAEGKASCPVRALTENQEVAEYRKISSVNRVCGKRPSQRIPHHRNPASLADHGDFPWILRLLYAQGNENTGNARLQCGASLVHHSIALTTASCVLDAVPESLYAVSGEWNIVTGHGRNDIRERKIKKIIVHPMFDAFHFTNDLALLFLDEPFQNPHAMNATMDTSVNTVCLPMPNDRWNSGRCLIVGWSLKNENGENQPLLRKIDVAIISQGKCRNRFNALESDRSYFSMSESPFICAYAQDEENPCMDDGGASLVCPSEDNPNSYVQIGFSSQKTICNQGRRAATFTTIFNILDWISQLETNYFSSES